MPIKVTVKHWHAAAAWTWNAGDDVCGICRMPFDGCPPGSKFPGDDSPVVWGTCGHAFHLQCISKWLQSDTDQVSVSSHRKRLCRGSPPTRFWFTLFKNQKLVGGVPVGGVPRQSTSTTAPQSARLASALLESMDLTCVRCTPGAAMSDLPCAVGVQVGRGRRK